MEQLFLFFSFRWKNLFEQAKVILKFSTFLYLSDIPNFVFIVLRRITYI